MERWSERIRAVAERALARGALEPIITETLEQYQHGFPFVLRWVSTLARKPRPASERASKVRNPFLPPEPELTVGALGTRHLVVLNKYPVFSDHVLIVTRDFEPQTAPLSGDDFRAWHALLAEGGLGFYNGGEIAGASQPHRHLQWIPDGHLGEEQLGVFLPGGKTGWAALPWAAWREPLPLHAEDTDWGAAAHRAYCTALAAMGWSPGASQLPPYDLLLARPPVLHSAASRTARRRVGQRAGLRWLALCRLPRKTARARRARSRRRTMYPRLASCRARLGQTLRGRR